MKIMRYMLFLFAALFLLLPGTMDAQKNSAMVTSGPNLEILTSDVQAYNTEILPAFSLGVSADEMGPYVDWNMVVMNTGNATWSSGDPNIYPERYEFTLPMKLYNFVRGEIVGPGNVVVETVNPLLWDLFENVAVGDPRIYPYQEDSEFNGFHITPQWANTTTANNADPQAGRIRFSSIPPDGNYTLVVTLDPLNLWGQRKQYTQTFSMSGSQLMTKSTFRKAGPGAVKKIR